MRRVGSDASGLAHSENSLHVLCSSVHSSMHALAHANAFAGSTRTVPAHFFVHDAIGLSASEASVSDMQVMQQGQRRMA